MYTLVEREDKQQTVHSGATLGVTKPRSVSSNMAGAVARRAELALLLRKSSIFRLKMLLFTPRTVN